MRSRNWYFPLFLPGGTQGFPTYGWYVVYGWAPTRFLLDGFHVSDVQPIGPWPSYSSTLELCEALNLEEANRVLPA